MKNLMRSGLGVGVVFAVAVLLIAVASGLFSGIRFDLTEHKLYTLSEGTKNIVGKIEQPVELTLYFSDKGTTELPALRTYANRVKELLREYESLSKGKLTLKIVDPEPFSEAEDEAAAAGLQGIPVGARSDEIYFGLVGRSGSKAESDDASVKGDYREEVIPFFQMDKEAFLEYDLTKLVFNLSQQNVPVLGIVSKLDLNGGFDYMSRQQTPAWVIVQQIEDLFEIRWIPEDAEKIDEDVNLLLVVHPQNLAEQTLFAIDQFVLNGGNSLIFVDPLSEAQQGSPMMPTMDKSSDMAKLFEAWGVSYDPSKIVGDYRNSMVVSMGQSRSPVRHIGLQGLNIDNMSAEDVVVAGLENVNIASAGALSAASDASTTFTPLLMSSQETMLYETDKYAVMQSPEELMSDFAPSGVQYVFAARVTGKAATAFSEGVTIEEEVEEEPQADAEEDAEPVTKKVSRTLTPSIQASDTINLIIVADTDVLTDRLWVQVQSFFGQTIASPWADNAGFLINSLDNLSGNADLISIRSRGRFSRPFDLVDDIRRQAEERFLEQQEILQQQLAEAESKLAELEQQRQAGDQRLLTPDQEKALAAFQEEKLKIRKELREVQHQLDQDIEALGAKLKLINILLVPLLLTLLVVVLRFIVIRRQPSIA